MALFSFASQGMAIDPWNWVHRAFTLSKVIFSPRLKNNFFPTCLPRKISHFFIRSNSDRRLLFLKQPGHYCNLDIIQCLLFGLLFLVTQGALGFLEAPTFQEDPVSL